MKIKGHIYKSFMIPRNHILQSTKQRVQTCDFTITSQVIIVSETCAAIFSYPTS